MNFADWLKQVPADFTGDPLWKMEVYRLAMFAAELAWPDSTKLLADKRTITLADQLNRSVGAVAPDIAEGYSRQSGKDQARFYEYALGSAREARNWYHQGRHVLSERVSSHRIRLLTQIIRLLLTIIPHERAYRLQDDEAPYRTDSPVLDEPAPLP